MKYSVIVPVYNEQDNVKKLHQDIVTTMSGLDDDYEIIFVDDGSSDDTVTRLQELSRLSIIQLRKNFGQTAALDAGIKLAQGEYIITLDGDGQNPPSEIPKLIKTRQDGDYDVVSGWRAQRQDPLMKKFVSRGANVLRKLLIDDGIHDSGCSLKIYKKACFDQLDLYGEMHRFIPAILKLKGYTVGEVMVQHQARTSGISKYNWKRTIKGFLDMIGVWFWKKYATRPLHLFGGIGMLAILISFILFLFVVYQKIILHIDLSNSILTEITFFVFIIGIILVIFGLMSDMLSKLYFGTSKDRAYSIKKITKK